MTGAVPLSVQTFTREAESLGFDIDAITGFNARIEVAIETAETDGRQKIAEALRLAQLKFLANQKFDRLRREQLEATA
jgi:hypothetical protein